MKRFDWPLQRLLDVTARRESARRAELVSLTNATAGAQGELFARQAALRTAMDELAQGSFAGRVGLQAAAMAAMPAERARRDAMKRRLAELRSRRREALDALTETRRLRRTLERLREKAWRRWREEADRAEQKALDESSQTAFVRARTEAGRQDERE